jgi:Protein kinase domain
VAELREGVDVGGYRIGRVLGHGGMGVVYEATQLSLDRVVALKVIAPHLSQDASFRERFRREAMLQAAIDHPSVVPVHETGESEHGVFLVMALVRGSSFAELVNRGEVDPPRAVRILSQIADALDVAHEKGLVHRDIKPQNILVGARDRAYLADFGLTRYRDATRLTKTDQFVGTVDYCAPEQIHGKPATAQTDVYALAAVLYQALTGSVPYERESDAAVMFAHVSEPPPSVTAKRPDLAPAVDEVIRRGMAKEPEERYASASDLVAAAERALGEAPTAVPATRPAATIPHADVPARTEPLPPVPPAPPVPAPWPAEERRRRRTPLVALALVLLGAGAGFLAGTLLADDSTPAPESPAPVRAGLARGTAGSLQLAYPRDWDVVEPAPPELEGSGIEDAVVLAPRGDDAEGGLFAGSLAGASADEPLPLRAPDARVQLDAFGAYVYDDIRRPEDWRQARTYVVRHTEGVSLVRCYVRRAADARAGRRVLDTCARIAAAVALVEGVDPLPLEPNPEYAAALGDVLADLNAARVAARRRLAEASAPARQRAEARALRDAYDDAARRLADVDPSPDARAAHDEVVAALRAARDAYAALEGVIAAADAADYGAARARVVAAERTVCGELRDLRKDRALGPRRAGRLSRELGYVIRAPGCPPAAA